MTAQDHLNYAQDLFKRAKICEDKATRDRIMDIAKDNLSYYFELIKKEEEKGRMSIVKLGGKCIAQNKLQRAVEDKRYTVALEFCGYPEARYVVRWCDKWLGQSANLNDAILIAICHQDERGLKLL